MRRLVRFFNELKAQRLEKRQTPILRYDPTSRALDGYFHKLHQEVTMTIETAIHRIDMLKAAVGDLSNTMGAQQQAMDKLALSVGDLANSVKAIPGVDPTAGQNQTDALTKLTQGVGQLVDGQTAQLSLLKDMAANVITILADVQEEGAAPTDQATQAQQG